ncbi:MAG: MgtC/SapB family protein [Firmicutes bacterium]|nr:MgtC/SapB family protein [Bacillota bacterium]
MEWINELMQEFWFIALLKLIVGALLTGFIGLQRSSLNKPAGFGTHAILGTSAVLVVLLSEYMSMNSDMDMSRIPAQLLSGIGFIGAGTILRDGINVKGVTTAAGLLAVTCIGLAVGSGFFAGAVIATIIVYLLLAYSHNISSKFERYAILDIELTVEQNVSETIEVIKRYLNAKRVEIKSIKRSDKKTTRKTEDGVVGIVGTYDSRIVKKNTIIGDLIALENISSVTDEDE